jgi:hypothetical protein
MKHEIIREIIAAREKASERPYCLTCDSAAHNPIDKHNKE